VSLAKAQLAKAAHERQEEVNALLAMLNEEGLV
jgi:hypothetical protein